jgi:hypothetical protein
MSARRNPDTPFLSTTAIPAEKTAAEIQELLGRGGARRVMSEYEEGEVVAISFSVVVRTLESANREVLFRLPVRWENYLIVMQRAQRAKKRSRTPVDPEQAKRTAWRVAKAWLEAQLALVTSEMASIQEVMLPYLVQQPDGLTLYERLESQGFKLLEHK